MSSQSRAGEQRRWDWSRGGGLGTASVSSRGVSISTLRDTTLVLRIFLWFCRGKARQEAGATSKFTFPIRLGGADGRCTLLAAYCWLQNRGCSHSLPLPPHVSHSCFLFTFAFSLFRFISPASALVARAIFIAIDFLATSHWRFRKFCVRSRVAILPSAQWWRIGRSENGCENLRVQQKWRT